MSSDVKIPDWAMEEGLRLANDSELSLVAYESSGSEIEEATKSDAEAIARALLAAEQRGLEKAAEVVRTFAIKAARAHLDAGNSKAIVRMFNEIADFLPAAIRSLGEKT